MAAKTKFSPDDFANILAQYDLGTYLRSEAIQEGTVQTNFFIETTKGRFVFRYYENRPKESVLFESHLLAYLKKHNYPCPAQIKNMQGKYVSTYRHKPFILFEFLAGRHVEQPTARQKQQLIKQAAWLQTLTMDYQSPYIAHRWNYTPELCQSLAWDKTLQINSQDAHEKYAWLAHTLTTLDLPPALPKGICHCDFHFSNVLFQEEELVALLDFDDANYTFLQFDLIALIENWAWPHTADMLDMAKARCVVQSYMKYRPLAPIEQEHLFDVHTLSILIDCIWFFARSSADDFYEKRKIEALTELGRQRFYEALF